VVIVGFGYSKPQMKFLMDDDGKRAVGHINGYLIDAPDIFVESRSKPLCDVPEIGIGNKPIDNGNYLFTSEEKDEFIAKEPASKPLFRPWIGSREFINGYTRYCLWLGDCTPSQLRGMPQAMRRVEAVRQFRLSSSDKGTRKLADSPTRFHVENMPDSTYVVIPEVSSERREYIPIGFIQPNVLASNLVKVVPNATLYHFGVLTSSVHNAWMRAVAGRLEMRYRYSKDIVYNNFPWPDVTPAEQEQIATLGQTILATRALYPDESLADLYDPTTMPPDLRRAHRSLDHAVEQAYGVNFNDDEQQIVAHLFELYEQETR
jgi:hypothetical protein